MPNANYLAGVRLERAVQKDWEAEGYNTIRAAGSHGLFDVVAFRSKHPPTFIQCKRTTSQSDAESLLRDWDTNPPLTPSRFFHQALVVQVKGSSTKHRRVV